MAGTSESTIIAAFRNSADADAAAAELESAGFDRDDIYLETSGSTKTSSSSKFAKSEHGISGWFKSMFGHENDQDRAPYEDAVQQGSTLLRVDVMDEEVDEVEDILNRHSPIDVHSDGRGAATTQSGTRGSTRAIPVVEEELQVGKRQVLRGGVRVYTRVVEEPVEENISLREERVRVERRPVNRAATDADLRAGKEEVIEVQEIAEEPVISKQARVVEEVHVGKDVSERTQKVRDTVRRTEVNVEQNPGGTATGSRGATYDDTDFRSDYQQRYSSTGEAYDTYSPAYRYGYDMASDARYNGRSWDEVEPDLRSDYGSKYPNSTWERMKDAVRYGWDKVTGKTRAAAR